MKTQWLAAADWGVVIATNHQLCLASNALHRPTSDGYEATKNLWESTHKQVNTIAEATELCRRCHRLAPFCNFNGNTFVTIIRRVVSSLSLPPGQAAAVRSFAGHIVAGIATKEEEEAYRAVLAQLDDS